MYVRTAIPAAVPQRRVVQFDLNRRSQRRFLFLGRSILELIDRVTVVVTGSELRAVGAIDWEARCLQSGSDLVAQLCELFATLTLAHRRGVDGHDLEIDVLRHAANQFVRASQASATQKNQLKRSSVRGNHRAHRTKNVPVLFDEYGTRETEVFLGFTNFGWIIGHVRRSTTRVLSP
jgi:hypothetical protein